jgi:hypothetical protein
MQLCRISLLFPYFLVFLHVSSDVIAHHQEHLSCSYNFGFYSRVSLSAAEQPTTIHVNKTRSCNYSLDAPDDER